MNNATESTEAEVHPTALSRELTGKVVSNKMHKTIAVDVERLVRHPRYGKYVRRTTRLLAHDENNESKAGDTVTIAECRPLSRRKSWRLVNVLQRVVDVRADAAAAKASAAEQAP